MANDKTQLNPVEQLVIMQAAYDAIGKEISRQGNGLRSDVDAHFHELYEQTGSKSFEVKLLGDEVGTMSIRFSKPKPSEIVTQFRVTDYVKLCKRVSQTNDGFDVEIMRKYIETHVEDFAEYYFYETGECLPGTVVSTETVPEQPKQYIGTTLRVDKRKIADICEKSLLTNITRLLLGAGDE